MITKEIAIELIEEKIAELDAIRFSHEFEIWQSITLDALKKIAPDNKTVLNHFKELVTGDDYGEEDWTEDAKEDALIILEGFIKHIERLGIDIPSKQKNKSKGKVKVKVTQANHQNQTTNITIFMNIILDSLRDELRPEQIEEVQEILNTDEPPAVRRRNFIEKIKSFGSDVASNILATILTNPQVYDQLGSMM